MNFFGRRMILTSCLPKSLQAEGYAGETLNDATVVREVNNALKIHRLNEAECIHLEKIYRGDHAILHRPQGDRLVNNKVVLNYPLSFTRRITGYTYSGGIQYTAIEEKHTKEVQLLNTFMKCENKAVFDKVMADNQSIFGTSYISVFYDSAEKNEVPFELSDLSPCNAFVAYSAANRHLPVFSWNCYSIRVDGKKQYIHQICSRDYRWVFKSSSKYRIAKGNLQREASGPHILGDVPIIEYPNNEFRLGDWEFSVSLMDAINNMASDGVNDVEQTVLSYLALFGISLEADDVEKMKKNRLLCFPGTPGVNQDAKFITAQIDGTSAQLLRSYLEQALNVIVGIPDRDTGESGSDTGISAQIRTGSDDMDIVAKNKTVFSSMSERRLLRIVINILTPKYLKNLSVRDIEIDIPRDKLADIVSKTQAGATLNAMGVAKTDIAKVMDITTDIIGFCKRWEENQKQQPDTRID